MKNSKTPASKGKTNTAQDQDTADQNSVHEDQMINLVQLEALLSTFNDDATKQEICKHLMNVQDLIVEEEEEVVDGEAKETIKIQKVTLPDSGKVVKGIDNTLREAFSLIQAWNKATKNMMN